MSLCQSVIEFDIAQMFSEKIVLKKVGF